MLKSVQQQCCMTFVNRHYFLKAKVSIFNSILFYLSCFENFSLVSQGIQNALLTSNVFRCSGKYEKNYLSSALMQRSPVFSPKVCAEAVYFCFQHYWTISVLKQKLLSKLSLSISTNWLRFKFKKGSWLWEITIRNYSKMWKVFIDTFHQNRLVKYKARST